VTVDASTVRMTAQTTITGLDTSLIAAVTILAIALTTFLVLFIWRPQSLGRLRNWIRRARPTIDNNFRLALARSAYERGDNRRVRKLLTEDREGTPHNSESLPDLLLLAAAGDQLGREDISFAAFQTAADLLKNEDKRADEIARLSSSEHRILAGLTQLFPDLPQVDTGAEATTGKQSNSLAKPRQTVAREKKEAEGKSNRWFWTNVMLGGLSALTAAGAGVGAGASSFLKDNSWVIVVLGLGSAAISTISTTLKPAETADVAKKSAEALDDLLAEIDFYEIDGPHESDDVTKAEKEVQNRLRTAMNRPRPIPLISPPKNQNVIPPPENQNGPDNQQDPTQEPLTPGLRGSREGRER
jgi:hypothetical protein